MRVITLMKYIGALTALASAVNAYAANSGFYVGVDGGRDTGVIQSNISTPSTDLIFDNHMDGFLLGAHAGYNLFLTQHFLMGTEIFWNHSDAQVDWSHSSPNSQRNIEIKDSWGASLLPGWQLDSNNRLYTRLGWIQSQFSQQNTSAAAFGPSFQDKQVNGLEVGLGYLVTLANQWDLRMEYDHRDYSTIKRNLGASSFSDEPAYDNYTLGVDYNFDPTQIKFADSIAPSATGWYIGGLTGRDDTTMRAHITDAGSTDIQKELSLRGTLGGAQVGYDWQLMRNFVLGVEGFGYMNSSRTESHATFAGESSINKLREEHSVGVSVLPGYQLNPANLIYTRIGYVNTKFSGTGPADGLVGAKFNTTKLALELGLGYSVALATHWSLFMEYDYADYPKIDTGIPTDSYDYDTEDNQYKLGVNYHF